ncbi:response regulator [Stigmatella aurantiaca]|uniref:Response regulator n=1 Tax=Stigmatella aurantiaca (strain DW4/3-1) TaxID=378806 RepID=Q08SQ0_STIAD|nr:response regulator [Stigmatella aurantiaca]ADO71278.1 Response regulator receiver protein [Stigmatella aurantiaca DW4/3-1]EAU63515.1 response regulator [Stigmatella aurantiaca DW4/3-1]
MKTILVVDDEFDIAEAVKAILEEDGYQVYACGNGWEALKCLNDLKPDLAILDIMMPRLNGYETLRALRQRPAFAQLPVLLMSAIVPEVKSHEHSWSGFLKKPFSLGDLLKQVHQLVPKTAPEEESPV